MRGRFPLLALTLAGTAAVLLRRRRAAPGLPPGFEDDRAADLRRKLAEARDLDGEREAFEEAETPIDQAEPPGVDERRRKVHERGRAAADEMGEGH